MYYNGEKDKYVQANFSRYRDKMLKHLCDNGYEIAKDILNGDLGSLERHKYSAYDAVIDWDTKQQCKNCHAIFDGDFSDDEFCGEDCEEDYVEPLPIWKEAKER